MFPNKDLDPSRSYRIEALAKGLSVLSLFHEDQRTLRVTEISQLTGIPLPTAFRIVRTLEELGYVDRLPDGSLTPGLAVLQLGAAAVRSNSLIEAAQRPVERLAEATSETVNLGVLSHDRVLYVARRQNRDLVTANLGVGSTLPAVYTSMGKLLLAFTDPDGWPDLITSASFSENSSPKAHRDLDGLRPHLEQIRADGYAIQDEELAPGLRSIAVPILTADERCVAAINIAVATSRYEPEGLLDLLEPLRQTAHEISLRLATA